MAKISAFKLKLTFKIFFPRNTRDDRWELDQAM